MKKITLIIPCLNEEENINEVYNRMCTSIKKIQNYDFEYIFIDDGSSDKTFVTLKKIAEQDNNLKIIKFSRHFGNHAAITAGIDYASNTDALIVTSADLQEPPEKFQEMINIWNNKVDIVWTIRKKRSQNNIIKKIFSYIFYKFFIRTSSLKSYPLEGPSCFFLIDKKVINNFKYFKEKNRNVLGMIAWMGFNQEIIYYDQNERKYGKSGFNFFKLIRLAIDTIISFSYFPIRFIYYMGSAILFFGLICFFYILFTNINIIAELQFTRFLIFIILFLGGIQLLTIGILGEYIWRGLEESKNRPLYLINEKINF